jgi:Domain of unknown function (DUF929)
MNKAERAKARERILVYASIVISVVALGIASVALAAPRTIYVTNTIFVKGNGTNVTVTPLVGYNISSAPIIPSANLSDAPVITAVRPPGNTLTGINEPLDAVDLGAINNAPNAYFEIAGNMLLNGTLNNSVGLKVAVVPTFVVNGKPSVIYVGSITCIWCAANRWSMALALSRFGNFTNLFKGYSSLGDGDAPTLYWAPVHYESTSVTLGSFYSSKYLNFLPVEESAPITGGFSLQPLSVVQQDVNQTGNLAYIDEVKYIIAINTFGGTPYTIWGNYVAAGADARAFGNSSQSYSLLNMTHQQMMQQIARPSSQLGWTEYAGADYYTAMICKTIGNTAQVCGLPAIRAMEPALG